MEGRRGGGRTEGGKEREVRHHMRTHHSPKQRDHVETQVTQQPYCTGKWPLYKFTEVNMLRLELDYSHLEGLFLTDGRKFIRKCSGTPHKGHP